jgi:hypothetical protein
VDAKMKANCILPSSGDCHSPAVQMLKGVAQRYPDKVRVEFATMEQLGEKALTQQVGSYCAAVIINGKSDFDVAFEGSTRHVSLVGSAPSHYSLRDLLDCVTTVYTDLYGAPSEPLATLPEGELATGKLRDSAKGSEPALDFDLPKPAQLQLRQ